MDYCKKIIELEKLLIDKTIYPINSIDFSKKHIIELAYNDFTSDYARYYPSDKVIDIAKIINWGGAMIAILNYRLSRQYFLAGYEDSATTLSNIGKFFSGIEIFYSASIGKSLKIYHGVGTVIGARCSIGDNALIHQNVTIGDKKNGRPIIGNNVIIYAGAKILGEITLGNNTIIGANCVCLQDIPEGKKAVGIPARII